MLADLVVPYVDVSAGDLRWALSSARMPALASVDMVIGAATVRLAVLGASHEVVVEIGGHARCTEAIACGVAQGEPLPASAGRNLPGIRYELKSTVLHLPSDELARCTDALRARLALDDFALVAAFPGHAEAVTALAVGGDGPKIHWRTWHAYPATGELVMTRTLLSAVTDRHTA